MTIVQLLSQLRRKGIQLWTEDGKLRTRAPSGALTHELRQELIDRKEEVLAFLDQARVSTKGDRPPAIEPIARNGGLELSFAQERLWLLHQLAPDSPIYHIRHHLNLKGPLNIAAFERCLNEMFRRHESLRTTFSESNGKPVQIVVPPKDRRVFLVDVSGLARKAARAEVQRLIRQQNQPFDLSVGPLLRSALVKLGTDEHEWFLCIHHIIWDGWSLGVFRNEFSVLYGAFTTGAPSPLPELRVQYADFSHWQRQWLSGEILERHVSYWRQELRAPTAVLELPTDRPRRALQTFRGSVERGRLSEPLSQRLRDLSHREGVTPFMILLAAFQTFLHRYTGQDDILVGTPIANRNPSETEGLIGLFVNALVLRSDLVGDPVFRDLLGRVKDTTLGAYKHQDLPFELLVKELQPQRDLSNSPFFQVMLVMQNTPQGSLRMSDVEVSGFAVDRIASKFDLSVTIVDRTALVMVFSYNADFFEAATIKRMMRHFEVLLEDAVARPDRRLSALRMLSEAELNQLLVEWNNTYRSSPKGVCLHQPIERQAAETPAAVALVYEEEQVTFYELNQRANQLAHYLRELGVGPEVLVGIMLERSVEMVVGVLGILKAGAAYVPLDQTVPRQRLNFMVQDSRISVLVVKGREQALGNGQQAAGPYPNLEPRTPVSGHRSAVGCPEPLMVYFDDPAIGNASTHNPTTGVGDGNLAYVLYTSGSSGQPKGVLVEHRQVVNYLRGIEDRLGFEAGARYAMVQPLTVDSCVTVLFPPLFSGGCVHVLSQERALDPAQLAEYFWRQSIDCLKIAPSHLRALQANAPEPERLLPSQWIVIGGEASLQSWMWKLGTLAPSLRVFNHYGPTEATVGTLMYAVEKESGDASAVTPLGHPLPNTTRYVLDVHLQPVGWNITGQLYLGGKCLSRGYLGKPELTAASFLPHPFAEAPGSRLYGTGDLVKVVNDGAIEFLGRMDDQVKIAGFRIEPREIEVALVQCPQVHQAVVAAQSGSLEESRLVAYVVVEEGAEIGVDELRVLLESKLPDYMVPQLFVFLDELSLTPNGKVDRKALPEPQATGSDLGPANVDPRTDTQERLELLSELHKKGARLWAENGKLRLRAPSGTLTEDMRRALAQHKQQILELLERFPKY